MIVELFGAPGAGKTTFAQALTDQLRENGHIVELALSYRPAECSSPVSLSGVAPVARRLARPFVEVLAIARHPVVLSHDISAAAGLVKLLPPRNMVLSIRFSQYILRLLHSWRHAYAVDHIVLFDQAFVQLIYSLVLFGRAPNVRLMARALDCAPQPDLLVRLDASTQALTSRLEDRFRQQGALERLLEPDLMTLLNSIGVIDVLNTLLRRRGQLVVPASSLDEPSLRKTVKSVAKQIAAISSAHKRAMAS